MPDPDGNEKEHAATRSALVISLRDDVPVSQALSRAGCRLLSDGSIGYLYPILQPHIETLHDRLVSGKIDKKAFCRGVEDLAKSRGCATHGPRERTDQGQGAQAFSGGEAPVVTSPVTPKDPQERPEAHSPEQDAGETLGPQVSSADSRAPATVRQPNVAVVPVPLTEPAVGGVSISPPGGRYSAGQRVRMVCATPGAVIRYTSDGAEPTSSSVAYRDSLLVERTCRISARAFLGGAVSRVATEDFVFEAGRVSAEPPGGEHHPPLTVELRSETSNATIRFTTDGTEPTESSPLYPQPGIVLERSVTLRARAFKSGWGPGRILDVAYSVEVPTWKNLEPADRTDPVEHEICERGEPGDGWCLAGASARGKLHAHRALWREDSFAIGWQDEWHILVVGDGAGSSKMSRVGSRVACTIAKDTLKRHLDGFVIPVRTADAVAPGERDLLRLKTFLMESVRAAQAALRREASDRKISLNDLSSTLLAAVHTKWNFRSLVACVQVGDGAVALFTETTGLTLMGVADSGEFSGETRFLTTRGIEDDLDRRVLFAIKPEMKALVLMTDGVADDYFPAQEKLSDLFAEMFATITPSKNPEKALCEWLKYEKKGSSDDRTLVLLHRMDEA